jgi:integrase
MNTLRQALQDYIAIRRGLGYKFVHQEHRLAGFIAFLEERDANFVTTKLALEWATQPPGRHASWALRLADVRGFARHLLSLEPRTQVPPTGIIPYRGRIRPYLYSQAEIQTLLTAALALPPAHGLRRWTYHSLFGLLAVSGLRLSEVLMLQREDVDLETGILAIHNTKFGKSRLVPLHPTTQQVLLDYARQRDRHIGSPRSPYFLVAERGGRLLPQYVYRVFWRLSRQIGLRGASAHTGPRLHDFRHSSGTPIIPATDGQGDVFPGGSRDRGRIDGGIIRVCSGRPRRDQEGGSERIVTKWSAPRRSGFIASV